MSKRGIGFANIGSAERGLRKDTVSIAACRLPNILDCVADKRLAERAGVPRGQPASVHNAGADQKHVFASVVECNVAHVMTIV
jgi:hypothetical protein